MFGIKLKHSLAAVAVAAGVLAAAGPASAGTHPPGVVVYNGHAGAVKDGTSNTIASAARFSIDIGTSENLAADGLGANFILMADAGGQFH